MSLPGLLPELSEELSEGADVTGGVVAVVCDGDTVVVTVVEVV